MTFSLGLATFLTPKTQPNQAKTIFYEVKPCILQCFCVFLHDFRVFEPPRGASGGLLALSWGLLEPRDLILESFSFRKS